MVGQNVTFQEISEIFYCEKPPEQNRFNCSTRFLSAVCRVLLIPDPMEVIPEKYLVGPSQPITVPSSLDVNV